MVNTAVTLLKENKSLASYSRKRKALYCDEPSAIKKQTSHIPVFSNVSWDKEKVLNDFIKCFNSIIITKLVWSTFAEQHGISGSNRGQIVKEFVCKVELIKTCLTQNQKRSTRKRIPGTKISLPIPPTCHACSYGTLL